MQAKIEKYFQSVQVTINAELYSLLLAPRLKKETMEFRKQICNTWAQCSCINEYPNSNVPAFISNLGPNKKPKMLKVGPWVFQPLLV
jgi:hypothetical protein